jgi:hypothetical protein
MNCDIGCCSFVLIPTAIVVDFLSNLPEPFPDPKGISAQIQHAVDPNQLLVAVKTIKNRERKLRQIAAPHWPIRLAFLCSP